MSSGNRVNSMAKIWGVNKMLMQNTRWIFWILNYKLKIGILNKTLSDSMKVLQGLGTVCKLCKHFRSAYLVSKMLTFVNRTINFVAVYSPWCKLWRIWMWKILHVTPHNLHTKNGMPYGIFMVSLWCPVLPIWHSFR